MKPLKSAREILKDMGVQENSPESTQFALLRHLKRAAQQVAPALPISSQNSITEPIQLEFDLDGLKSWSDSPPSKKISSR